MDNMPNFDLTTPAGKQAFQAWLVNLIRNEINSYARQVLTQGNSGETIGGKRIVN